MLGRACRPLLAFAAFVFAVGAASANASETSELTADLARFQALDQRLQDIGWKLAAGNAPYCEDAPLSIGLQLQDMAVFGEPERVRAALGLTGDFAVQTAAAGSPSATALTANQAIVAIDGSRLDQWPAEARNHWQRLAHAHDTIEASLADNGAVSITPLGLKPVTLSGVPACASRFELATGHGRALAEGQRVIFGEKFVGFSFPEEEFAAVIAHELAHNVLGHRVWLEKHGRKRKNLRATEREADRLMPWLVANAGYEPEAALRFMQRWGPDHSRGFLTRARSHEGWDERAEHIAAEVERVKAVRGEDGSADWNAHFRREVSPDGRLTPVN